MSKIKNYDRILYESIEQGLRELMKPHKFVQMGEALSLTYTPKAYEEVIAFLCINDIPHTFSINPVNTNLRARVMMVTWEELDGTERNLAWWEKIPTTDCYLVRFEENWSDEMDISAFALFTDEEYNIWSQAMYHLSRAMNDGGRFEHYFGTNEFNEYEDFEEFGRCFTTKVIPAESAKIIREAFDIDNYYGDFPNVDTINYYLEIMGYKKEGAE